MRGLKLGDEPIQSFSFLPPIMDERLAASARKETNRHEKDVRVVFPRENETDLSTPMPSTTTGQPLATPVVPPPGMVIYPTTCNVHLLAYLNALQLLMANPGNLVDSPHAWALESAKNVIHTVVASKFTTYSQNMILMVITSDKFIKYLVFCAFRRLVKTVIIR